MEDISEGNFAPTIVKRGKEPVEFAAVPLKQYADLDITNFATISEVLEQYYADKNIYTRIRQKSVDLRKVVTTALERNRKKYDLQAKQLKDTEKRDK